MGKLFYMLAAVGCMSILGAATFLSMIEHGHTEWNAFWWMIVLLIIPLYPITCWADPERRL